MRKRTLSIALGLMAALLFSSGANALPINPGNSGLSLGYGYGGLGFSILYEVDGSGAVSGDIDIVGGFLTFEIDLASAEFSAIPSSDGDVTGVSFSNVAYTGSVAVTTAGSTHTIDNGQIGQISATLTPSGAGAATNIAASSVLITGVCNGTPGANLGCALVFGPQSDFSASVNGETRSFSHTLDVAAAAVPVPEPRVAMLLGLGLMALGAARPPRG
jgi:hypothetical protein